MRKSIVSLLLLGMAGYAGGAIAQNSMPAFEDVDQNGDGVISQEEAQTVEGLDFAAADTNQDGQLSREEYTAAMDH